MPDVKQMLEAGRVRRGEKKMWRVMINEWYNLANVHRERMCMYVYVYVYVCCECMSGMRQREQVLRWWSLISNGRPRIFLSLRLPLYSVLKCLGEEGPPGADQSYRSLYSVIIFALLSSPCTLRVQWVPLVYWSLDMEWSAMEGSGDETLTRLPPGEDPAPSSTSTGSSSSSIPSSEAVAWLYSPCAIRCRASGFLWPVVFLIFARLFWNQIWKQPERMLNHLAKGSDFRLFRDLLWFEIHWASGHGPNPVSSFRSGIYWIEWQNKTKRQRG